MKPCNPDLLAAVCAGYVGLANPHLWSSNMWEAHLIGQAMAARHIRQPSHAYKSRGSSYLMDGRKFTITYKNGCAPEVVSDQ